MIIQNRILHQKYQLKNGITIFYLPMDIEIGEALIRIPFGHKHNTGDIPLGGFHFLEHSVLKQSKKFPEVNSFTKFIGMEGGYRNATTSFEQTYYEIQVPSVIFKESFEGLLSHIYEPIFKQDIIDNEKIIIKNERNRLVPFFPGKTEKYEYLFSEVMHFKPFSLEKRLGDDKTLDSISVSNMEDLHKYYFTNKTIVFLGGNIDLEYCIKLLEKIKTIDINLDGYYEPLTLKNKNYHEKSFKEVSRYEYHFGYLANNGNSYEFFKAQNILWLYLINVYSGAIYKWLRKDNGWVYEINKISYAVNDKTITGLYIPLSKYEQVDIVRKNIDEHIIKALQDNDHIKQYVESLRRSAVFDFQTLDSRVSLLLDTYDEYGYPITDELITNALNKIEQPGYLLNFYLNLKKEGEFCEFLAKPIE